MPEPLLSENDALRLVGLPWNAASRAALRAAVPHDLEIRPAITLRRYRLENLEAFALLVATASIERNRHELAINHA